MANGNSVDARAEFLALFPKLVTRLVDDLNAEFSLDEGTVRYIRRNVEYNVPHGKLNRGLAVRQCFQGFKKDPSGEELEAADVLGWCVEFLQGYFLVADDIMDASITRRGQPCWYKLEDVKLNAINDAMMLEAMIFRLLKMQFKKDSAAEYVEFLELFLEITYTTEVGQLLDLTSTGAIGDIEKFSPQMLKRIYRYKTSHYSFYLPCALGMRLAGVTDTRFYSVAKDVCLAMGEYFQAQDDYLDCFGDPAITGKVGTDIEDCTCTWLVVQALSKIGDDAEKKVVLLENYGRNDPEKVGNVKALYEQLELKDAFARFEQESYESISKKIESVADDMPVDAFRFLLAKIYKRSK